MERTGKKGEERKAAETEEEREALAQFEEVTEAASMLMDAGELDVYSLHHSDFASAAALYDPQAGQATTSAAAMEEEDMFGEELEGEGDTLPGAVGAASGTFAEPLIENGGHAPAGREGGAAQEQVDFASWSVRELRQFLEDRGIDTSTATEKEELISRAREAAAAGAGPGSGGDVGAPEGYVYDEGSGYYYSAESGLYWDAASGGFYSGEHQKWYSFDQETQQYVEWPEAGASGDGPAGTDGEDAMVEGDASEVAAEDGGEGAT